MASNIQGAVNSMIGAAGQAATLFQLTPTGQEFMQKKADTREFNRQMKIHKGTVSNLQPALNDYNSASPEDQAAMRNDPQFSAHLDVAREMVPKAYKAMDELNYNYKMKYGTPEEAIKVLTERQALQNFTERDIAEQNMSKSLNQRKQTKAQQKTKVKQDQDKFKNLKMLPEGVPDLSQFKKEEKK